MSWIFTPTVPTHQGGATLIKSLCKSGHHCPVMKAENIMYIESLDRRISDCKYGKWICSM